MMKRKTTERKQRKERNGKIKREEEKNNKFKKEQKGSGRGCCKACLSKHTTRSAQTLLDTLTDLAKGSLSQQEVECIEIVWSEDIPKRAGRGNDVV